MGRSFSAFAGAGWAQAGTGPAQPGNLAVGVSLGSGYQAYFSGLGADEQNAAIAMMKAAGISWVRIDVAWSDTVQSGPTKGFDWSYPMLVIGPLLAAGLNVLPILWWSPSWARAVGANTSLPDDPFPTISPTAYAAFCGAAAGYFGPLGIQAFELWNEPNLDSGGNGSSLGLGYLSPVGYASLTTAAYQAIHADYVAKPGCSPTPTVVGGALAGWARLDYAGNPRAGAAWPAVPKDSTSAVVTCPTAVATDQYKLITGSAVSVATDDSQTAGLWPSGSYISSVTATGYVVSPPPWLPSFPVVNASSGTGTFGVENGYPPDVFLTQAYAAADGPMFDALSMHPYTWPGLPANAWLDSGSWTMVPSIRQIMVTNGDGAKPMWFTEIGAPTGQSTGSWPAVAATAGTLTVSCAAADESDLGYLAGAAGLPVNSYVAAVDQGTSWTLMPPTGLTVNQSLVPGSSITTLAVAAAANVIVATASGSTTTPVTVASTDQISIPSGTELIVWLGNGNGYYGASLNGFALPPFTVTTTESVQLKPGQTATITIDQATVPALSSATGTTVFPAGGLIQCAINLGQTWATAIAATSAERVNLVAPGVYSPWSIAPAPTSTMSTTAQQAAIIGQSYTFVTSTPWPYVGPVFVYCWSDASTNNNAGPFGLTRLDGTAKPALANLAGVTATGGLLPGLGLPGYV